MPGIEQLKGNACKVLEFIGRMRKNLTSNLVTGAGTSRQVFLATGQIRSDQT